MVCHPGHESDFARAKYRMPCCYSCVVSLSGTVGNLVAEYDEYNGMPRTGEGGVCYPPQPTA